MSHNITPLWNATYELQSEIFIVFIFLIIEISFFANLTNLSIFLFVHYSQEKHKGQWQSDNVKNKYFAFLKELRVSKFNELFVSVGYNKWQHGYI